MRANRILCCPTVFFIFGVGSCIAAGSPPTADISRLFHGANSWDDAVSTLLHALEGHEAPDEANLPQHDPSYSSAEHEEIGGPLGEAIMQSRRGSGDAFASATSSSSSPLVNEEAIDPHPSGTFPMSLTTSPTRSRTINHAPHLLEVKALSIQERSEILYDLHFAMSRRRFRDDRQTAWPLLMENMSPVDYQNLYTSLTGARYRGKEHLRYLWIRDGVTYSLSRPKEASDGFVRMHGSNGLRNENVYAVWRLEYYEQMRIWRYLGAVKVPGRRPLETLTWAQLSKYFSVSKPTVFLNDAAHLDPDQTFISEGQPHS
ncbi:f-box/wd-repeat protein lin-23 [Pseudozyma hubeiensis SY62]|uniref:F-box/wd-repeat protein lin-23 n=1 Tax=Pseudozyma hubeiensis (strain SY62) TaxID=1305764 RepID=R9PBI9_PSEHS|nr:f-box/wd-repeat protein lin-23 [Pseudozyma hubeiensis SY62]GAC98768.1 f-box/wd-repeat protein lin-23 [Pseudozyma hubeiensis SY62]